MTRASGRIVLRRPTVNLLAGPTVDWMSVGLTEDDVMSGFIPRFIFIPASKRELTYSFPGRVDEGDYTLRSHAAKDIRGTD